MALVDSHLQTANFITDSQHPRYQRGENGRWNGLSTEAKWPSSIPFIYMSYNSRLEQPCIISATWIGLKTPCWDFWTIPKQDSSLVNFPSKISLGSTNPRYFSFNPSNPPFFIWISHGWSMIFLYFPMEISPKDPPVDRDHPRDPVDSKARCCNSWATSVTNGPEQPQPGIIPWANKHRKRVVAAWWYTYHLEKYEFVHGGLSLIISHIWNGKLIKKCLKPPTR